ncbi:MULTISPECIES: helix-turn-helix transcriptional regulator [Oceanobacillus]|uniref:Transcriptional regulator n=1 Tax=Oceanobacillus kimchii TaxID=746691 RepID=A0ABQ5TF26_9BACI|nr:MULTISPECIES: helix-turn-helix transcriptional regulator [Oceanobacillus]MBT2599813.1 helix-turn-helix transcriptional regulator [Oceanobacillus sp. ISL-74]MBT2652737.1 helix-turn-helix transcriptional regulator [Oceanobacillus sp. ISL-73]MCT1577280.1 helix-turn-helix domain-containing protein [Oceanobacillus kimchii]MCT2135350.1 helix-turn-helix domain-containing protein [Oceanobacillus kimchii]OEH56613.1 transcriptional regulator [Oceanobacillus sp. E9]
MDKKRIGRRIKAFRKLKGYTQIQFAKEMEISTSKLGNIERGTKQPSDQLLDEIAEKLSISREELILKSIATDTEDK